MKSLLTVISEFAWAQISSKSVLTAEETEVCDGVNFNRCYFNQLCSSLLSHQSLCITPISPNLTTSMPRRPLSLVGINPSDIVSNPGVHTRIPSLSTSLAPTNRTSQDTSASDGDGSTRVTRARVLARSSGTEHVVCDGRSTVLGTASSARDNRDGDVA